jgi:hypothetical protein
MWLPVTVAQLWVDLRTEGRSVQETPSGPVESEFMRAKDAAGYPSDPFTFTFSRHLPPSFKLGHKARVMGRKALRNFRYFVEEYHSMRAR